MCVAHEAVISAPIIRVSLSDSLHLVPEDQPVAIASRADRHHLPSNDASGTSEADLVAH